ncbi:MAG: efflux RND transporter periplasmic adaptor subunit [Gallionella sp.]|nr:efflux RND transporter periplasmic adaptor subunit [Gallionella sp.]
MNRSILFLLLVPILTGCNKEIAPAAKIERPALTMVVGSAATASGNTYSGEVRARYETQLGFRIGGKIIERLVDAGARVKAGQALMRLDPGDAGLQLGSAEAQYQLAEADAKRYRELRGKGFISQSALEAKEAALKAAAAQAGLARNQSAYTTLHADRAGVIAATLAEAGQVATAGQPVLRLAPDGEREVAIAIPESQLTGLKIGAAAEIALLTAGSSAPPLAGRLRELAPAADPLSRTYAARVMLTKPGPDVALGMTARVRFTANKKSDGLLIPLTAIFQQDKQAAVWIVAADHTVSLRPVQVAAYRDDGAVIAGGLAAGERIVSNGVHRLAAGEKIRIVESGSAQ